MRAVLRATKPSQPGVNLQPPAAEIEVTPDRIVMLLTLPMTRGVRALRAMKATTAQRDRDHHTTRPEADRPDPHPGQVKQARECGRDAHGRNLRLEELERREPTVPTRARRPRPSRYPATSEESLLRPENPCSPVGPSHLRSSTEPPNSPARASTNSVSGWFGISTSGYGLRITTVDLLVRRLAARPVLQDPRRRLGTRPADPHGWTSCSSRVMATVKPGGRVRDRGNSRCLRGAQFGGSPAVAAVHLSDPLAAGSPRQ